ncbi:hypothetical protein J6590_043727 [Homalodisca vitripennis]|nr:hypothetical protein J6590_043727 [Homalodisca vitripennis]
MNGAQTKRPRWARLTIVRSLCVSSHLYHPPTTRRVHCTKLPHHCRGNKLCTIHLVLATFTAQNCAIIVGGINYVPSTYNTPPITAQNCSIIVGGINYVPSTLYSPRSLHNSSTIIVVGIHYVPSTLYSPRGIKNVPSTLYSPRSLHKVALSLSWEYTMYHPPCTRNVHCTKLPHTSGNKLCTIHLHYHCPVGINYVQSTLYSPRSLHKIPIIVEGINYTIHLVLANVVTLSSGNVNMRYNLLYLGAMYDSRPSSYVVTYHNIPTLSSGNVNMRYNLLYLGAMYDSRPCSYVVTYHNIPTLSSGNVNMRYNLLNLGAKYDSRPSSYVVTYHNIPTLSSGNVNMRYNLLYLGAKYDSRPSSYVVTYHNIPTLVQWEHKHEVQSTVPVPGSEVRLQTDGNVNMRYNLLYLRATYDSRPSSYVPQNPNLVQWERKHEVQSIVPQSDVRLQTDGNINMRYNLLYLGAMYDSRPCSYVVTYHNIPTLSSGNVNMRYNLLYLGAMYDSRPSSYVVTYHNIPTLSSGNVNMRYNLLYLRAMYDSRPSSYVVTYHNIPTLSSGNVNMRYNLLYLGAMYDLEWLSLL